MRSLIEQVRRQLEEIAPEVDNATIHDVVERNIPRPQTAEQVATHLASFADAWTCGAAAPLAVQRIIQELADAGATGVVRPRCSGCNRPVLHRHSVDGERVCSSCSSKANAKACVQCGRVRPVIASTAKGPVCGQCRRKDPTRWELCSTCGTMGPISRRSDTGPVCDRCYQQPKRQCDGCGCVRAISSTKSGQALCARCDLGSTRACGICGRVRRISQRSDGTNPDICDSCYRRPIERCERCGRMRPRNKQTAAGTWLCATCAPRPSRQCAICSNVEPPTANWDIGPVCDSCYNKRTVTCRGCKEVQRPHRNGTCCRCVLRELLNEVLGPARDDDGHPIELLRNALVDAPNSKGVIQWLDGSPTTQLLRRIAAGELPFEIETFDLLPDRAAGFIVSLCTTIGALPNHSIELRRFDRWLDERLADQPGRHATSIRSFSTWTIRRRLQQLADAETLTTSQIRNTRQTITQVTALLTDLRRRHLDLADLDQAQLEGWLAAGSTARYHVRPFIAWAREQALISRDITMPDLKIRQPVPPSATDDRASIAHRLLNDTTIELHVRVAGLLIILYAQHVTRISLLRHESIGHDGEHTTLQLGATPVRLPPPVAELVLDLRDQPPPTATQLRRETAWLFPGKLPGRPIVAHALHNALGRNGIPNRPHRNGALLDLAAAIPAPILADVLDLSPGIAEQWVRAAKGDWTTYVANRAEPTTATPSLINTE